MPSYKLMQRKIRRMKRKVHKLPVLNAVILAFTVIILSFFSFVAYTVYSAPQYQAEVQKVKTKHGDLAYYTRGKGEPVILLSGFGMTMQHWDPEFIERLAMGNQLIIVDYRGVGESSGKVEGINSDDMAQDVITLMDELKIDKAHIVGWSLGSFVAQIVAEKNPDRVEQLVLIATAPGGEEAVTAPKEIREKVQKNLGGSWEELYAPMMFSDPKELQAYLDRLKDARSTGESPKGKGESIRAKVAHQLAFADEGREKARYLNLSQIKAPTLLISGGNDKLTAIENPKKVEKRIKKAEHYIIPDAGHAVMFEDAQEVAKLIKVFFREK
jgi:pimeloyl-ACP methyl ester carboxylesterase